MHTLTDSVGHAVKKNPLMRLIGIIRWLLGKADVVASLDADYRKEVKRGSNFTSANISTRIVFCSTRMGMEPLVTHTTQVHFLFELRCTSIARALGPLIANKAPRGCCSSWKRGWYDKFSYTLLVHQV